MVTRKPVASLNTSNVAAHKPDPPYPTSPETNRKQPASASSVYSPDLSSGPAGDLIDMNEAGTKKRRDSDVSSNGTWDTDDEEKEDDYVEVPKPLRITPSKQHLTEQPVQQTTQPTVQPIEQQEELPAILRPGPANASQGLQPQLTGSALANPWANEHGQQQLTSEAQSNNPYLKGKQPADPSAAPLTNMPSQAPPPPPQQPTSAPVELPTIHTPAEELSKLSLAPGTPFQASVDAALGESAAQGASGQPQPAVLAMRNQSPTPQQKWGGQPTYQPPPGPPPSASQSLLDRQRPAPPVQPGPSSAQQATQSRPTSSQRSEHYQIKHINWRDEWTPSSNPTMRRSPILTQNANGPCPLLALVNALVLTTPTSANTALIEALRTREQISLGLLLDAVFDELTSGRRGDAAAALPDVGELYAFLLALHTGMNVNPRFLPLPRSEPVGGAEPSHLETAGEFEQTREMRLYSTFKVALIHGWLPQKNGPTEHAFRRCAQSFEDAQNIQFAESELEDKLRSSGLGSQEQLLLQDIQTIKHFLNTWPTQLTDRGLDAISKSLYPGQFAILFRNDHFSTIYKEPQHGALMTLVTDTGYSSHDEIVWESLVDVNGAASQLFSGDFRVVSHDNDARLGQSSSAAGQESWNQVPPRSRPNQHEHVTTRPAETAPPLPGPRPPTLANTVNGPDAFHLAGNEQEDHDLALALQLQEEELAQQRQVEDRRRREQQLSEQFLSSDAEARPPTIPPRRGGSRMSTSTRPGVNRPGDAAEGDVPPTYEQSSHDRPYREGTRPPQSNPLIFYDQLRQQEANQSAYAQQNANSPTSPGVNGRQGYGRGGRRPQGAATTQEAEERCVIM